MQQQATLFVSSVVLLILFLLFAINITVSSSSSSFNTVNSIPFFYEGFFNDAEEREQCARCITVTIPSDHPCSFLGGQTVCSHGGYDGELLELVRGFFNNDATSSFSFANLTSPGGSLHGLIDPTHACKVSLTDLLCTRFFIPCKQDKYSINHNGAIMKLCADMCTDDLVGACDVNSTIAEGMCDRGFEPYTADENEDVPGDDAAAADDVGCYRLPNHSSNSSSRAISSSMPILVALASAAFLLLL